MSIIEIQIRSDRFGEIIRGEINSQVLAAPTLTQLDSIDLPAGIAPGLIELKGKFLEKIECASCSFDSWDMDTSVIFRGTLTVRYHNSLADIRAAGSLQPAMTAAAELPFKITLKMRFDLSTGLPPALTYDLKVYEYFSVQTGTFALDIPSDIKVKCASIVGNEQVVAIRFGTEQTDAVLDAPVDHLNGDEWNQTIPGAFIAETVRGILDQSLDTAVVPPPPPDPNKPWLPQPKPQELRKDEAARAVWVPTLPAVVGTGNIIAVDACPLLSVDISIELSLTVSFQFLGPDTLKSIAVLTWDADSTWCDVLATLALGIPFGIGFHIGAESGVSDAVLGKSPSPGDGFEEVGHTDDSITFERVAWAPSSPSRAFVQTRAEVTAAGFVMGGTVRPKVAPILAGEMIQATSGFHINCNLRAVSMVFNPAQVVLRNAASGYAGGPPRVFLDHTIFDPANAWTVDTDKVNMSDPLSTSPQTVLTFVDPPTGRLVAGTATSVFLFTDYGVRWVDLKTIPVVPASPPPTARRLMDSYCDSIRNPWAHGVTHLSWDDPLVDPDYDHELAFDPLRLWMVGLRKLPERARIDFLAIGPHGRERLLGTIQEQQNAALEIVTEANETLAIRPHAPFSAPSPTLTRSWVYPLAARAFKTEAIAIASTGGLLGALAPDGSVQVLQTRELGLNVPDDSRAAQGSEAQRARMMNALSRQKARGAMTWSTVARIDKRSVALIHRGQLVLGMLGELRKVQ